MTIQTKGILTVVLASVAIVTGTPPARGETVSQVLSLSESAKSTIVKEHNKYRSEVNAPALEWSAALEEDARQWASYLAAIGGRQLIHASRTMRAGQGENLWMGSAGFFSYEDMVGTWAKERQYFKVGIFPNVSTTGNGYSVSHYTQVVWKNTTQIGCAQAQAGGNDVLVCRYNPAGNVPGQSVF